MANIHEYRHEMPTASSSTGPASSPTKSKKASSPVDLMRRRLSTDTLRHIVTNTSSYVPPIELSPGGTTELHVHAPKARRSLPSWIYSDDGYALESTDRAASPAESLASLPSAYPGRARYASFSSLAQPSVPAPLNLASSSHSPARRLVKYAFTYPQPSISTYPRLRALYRPLYNPTTFIIFIAILVRLIVSLAPHSGMAAPPMYGDFEAQRHWMELTLRLPVSQWYHYDLQWWGLDYPPLTAYVSWFWGWIGERFFDGKEGGWFALDASRGKEDESLKVFMRWTVVLSDAFIYIPAIVWWMNLWVRSARSRNTALLLTLLQPSLLLVDFGHFQYNSVMLGFTLISLSCFMTSRDLLGCVFFVLALTFKQMALYYAPAIGSYLLAKCLYTRSFSSFLKYGVVTLLTFIVIFLPFISDGLPQAIHRIFPLARGLFEDKVANFWCATDVIVKWRRRVSRDGLVLLSTGLTILFFSPATLVFLWPRKSFPVSPRVLPFALLTSSLAFFLFSFQVHEKTFLLPMLALISSIPPTSALPPSAAFEKYNFNLFSDDTNGIFVLMNNVACFSMWPLFKRDDLGLQYFTLIGVWNYLAYRPSTPSLLSILSRAIHVAMIVLHVLEAVFPPPARYPDLWPVLNVLLCTPIFGCLWVWSVVKMWEESWAGSGFDFGDGAEPLKLHVDVNVNGRVRGESPIVAAKTNSPTRVRRRSVRPSMNGESPLRARSPLVVSPT